MSTYGELHERILSMIAPEENLDVECNLIALPSAFDMAAGRKREKGIMVAGWDTFNRSVDGFRPHELTAFCGPTGSGKTTLLATLFVNFISQGVPSFCAPVEIGFDSFTRKLASIVSGYPMGQIEFRWQEIREKYFSTFFSNHDHALSVYESHVSHMRLMSDILHAYETRGTKIALVDNLNFMTRSDSDKSEIQVVNQVIQDWVRFVKKVPVHVIMVTHPKKTDGGRVESEFDIKGSSTIVQEAQNVILFNRLKPEDHVAPPLFHDYCRELKIAKCRENGRAWGTRIMLSLNSASEAYTEEGLLG